MKRMERSRGRPSEEGELADGCSIYANRAPSGRNSQSRSDRLLSCLNAAHVPFA